MKSHYLKQIFQGGWVLGIASIVLLLSGCSSKVESDFKKGCKASGGNRAFCGCLYERIEQNYGEDYLTAMLQGQAAVPENYAEVAQQATQHCAVKLK